MQNDVKVLIAEDEPNALMGLAELISGWGYRTETARDGIEAWEKVLAFDPAIVVTDLKMPRLDGIGLLTRLSEADSGINSNMAVVVLTAQGSIQLAVEAMKLGAYDFLQKPVDATRLRTILGNATRQRSTEIELEVARRRLRESGVLGSLVGSSKVMREIFGLIEQVAPSNVHVLITGESGTGKELVARTLHELSPRKAKPFVAVNCAAIPETLIESEIFGHEKGAFTGAIARKMGRLELANEGTLFLDEVGEMPLDLQPKLLRALQEREIERLGGTRPIPVNVRLIAATNRDLAQMVAEKQFRSDLFYRLKVFPIFSPPLRERLSDIPVLVRHFVDTHSRRMGKVIETIPEETMKALIRWPWPGNIRELENFLERAVILTRGPVLYVPLAELETEVQDAFEIDASESPTLHQAEREHILRVLRDSNGQIGGSDGAAARLGLKRTTLNSKIKKLGIERSDYMKSR